MDPGRERWLAVALSVVVFALTCGPPVLHPDGLEMFALVRSWGSEGGGGDFAYWPPLWPVLVWTLSGLGERTAAWIVNVVAAGGVAWGLHGAAHGLAGRGAARAAVLAWWLLPAVHSHAVVLDARPVGWLLFATSGALALEASRGRRAWWPAFAVAALAPLARPEGAALAPLILVAALVGGPRRWRSLLLGGLALLPGMLQRRLSGADRGAWESFWIPWAETWAPPDFLSLTGAASAPTPYRRFLTRAVEAGLEVPPSDPTLLLARAPEGAWTMIGALVEALGAVGLVAALGGAVLLALGAWRGLVGVGLVVAPLGALALLPMTWDQATLAANVIFAVPALLVLAVTAAERVPWRRATVALVVLLGIEAVLRPPLEPVYLEASPAAERMARWLQHHPPAAGRVACTLSGRGVVFAAGLQVAALPSTWEDWRPAEGTGVLLTTVDLFEGTRALEVLEDPAWQIERVSGDPWDPEGLSQSWMVYLER